jgi:hypothetical protein
MRRGSGTLLAMSDRVSLHRWTNHPAFYVFGLVFLMRDVILAGLALGGGLVGGLAGQGTLSIVAVTLAALALTGVVASSVAAQRRPGGLQPADHARAGLTFEAAPAHPRDAGDARREEPVAHVATHDAVADQLRSGRELLAEISSAQERGAWDDEGWTYRRRVEAWTERTADVLAGRGRADLASALAEVEVGPPPPFESLLKGYSPSYTRLVGLLEGRLRLLEAAQA